MCTTPLTCTYSNWTPLPAFRMTSDPDSQTAMAAHRISDTWPLLTQVQED